MFQAKYKDLIRNFQFSKVIDQSQLPGYIKHYIHDDEHILASYRTPRDHGVFTTNKIVLFDSVSKSGGRKQISTIPYQSISTISVTFEMSSAEFYLFLKCNSQVCLKFTNLEPRDKVRLRILYTCINRMISNQELLKKDLNRLKKDDVSFPLNG